MKKTLLIAIITLTLISCGLTKTTKLEKEDNGIERLDTISGSEKELNYTINVPNIWKPYITHGYINYTLKEKKDDYYKNHFFVIQMNDEVNEKYNLETFATSSVENRAKVSNNFKYNITSKRTKFGLVFIINSSSSWYGSDIMEVSHIYEYQKKLYTLGYSATEENYNKYIGEVENIFDTFKINE